MTRSGDPLTDALTDLLEMQATVMSRALFAEPLRRAAQMKAAQRQPEHRTRVRPHGPDAEAAADVLRALIDQLTYDRKSLYWREREESGIHHPSEIEAWLSSLIDSGWAPAARGEAGDTVTEPEQPCGVKWGEHACQYTTLDEHRLGVDCECDCTEGNTPVMHDMVTGGGRSTAPTGPTSPPCPTRAGVSRRKPTTSML